LTTQARLEVEKCRSRWIEGSATVVISASRTTRNCVRQTTVRTTLGCAGGRADSDDAIESQQRVGVDVDHHAVQPPSTLRM
jgi:hypothetical protein